MTYPAAQLNHAGMWASTLKRDREKRVARKYGADSAAAILAEAARIEAAQNARLNRPRVEQSALSTPLERDGVAELTTLVAEKDRRSKEAAALRRRVLASLRRLGFRRETATSGQSAYYHHLETDTTVRISDHDVPLTAARESDMAHGGHTWALSALSLVIDGNTTAREAGEWLVAIRNHLAHRLGEPA